MYSGKRCMHPLTRGAAGCVGRFAEPPEEFVREFQWNRERFPNKRASLKTMVDGIVKVRARPAVFRRSGARALTMPIACLLAEQEAAQADAELKRLTGEYNDVRNSVIAIDRKSVV